MAYDKELSDGELMTVDDFRQQVRISAFIDYDGYGHPVRDGKMDRSIDILPSKIEAIPEDATHILWFNK